MRDGHPFILQIDDNQQAIVCLNQKCGSSAWKHVLHKKIFPERWHSGSAEPSYDERTRDTMRVGTTSQPPHRFMWVRNPYARLLSAYVNKVVNLESKQALKFVPRGCVVNIERCKSDFQFFVEQLLLDDASWTSSLDPHFDLLSNHCGLDAGFEYDFYLKLEDMDTWYEALLVAWRIDTAANFGWSEYQPQKGYGDCFYVPTQFRDCEEFRRSVELNRRRERLGEPLVFRAGTAGPKTTGASSLYEYYNRSIADMLNPFLSEDLLRFGYPMWNGVYPME